MDKPLSAVVRVAASPAQAKIFVALLQAEGIPAYVEGDSLADEFASSRRLVNLIGTEVKVPTSSLERAREILEKVEIDPAELEQQALAAADGEVPVPPREPRPPRTHGIWPLVVASVAAVVFLGLWLAELDAKAAAVHPSLDYEFPEPGLMREIRRSDHRLLHTFEDRNLNLIWEKALLHGRDGKVVTTSTDENEDGIWERCVELHDDQLTATFVDLDGDGVYDEIRTTDAQDRVLQTLVWQPGAGYVIKKPR
ncbi:MAG TPA: DUF2007 domain-containing protein [Planctomycetota bacterium]